MSPQQVALYGFNIVGVYPNVVNGNDINYPQCVPSPTASQTTLFKFLE
jgi:hypothetical protein